MSFTTTPAEGDQTGPTYSYRGIDNHSYYLSGRRRRYLDDTGCGNTTRCAHPSARVLVLRSLRHWAARMGVDGFRFDLASVFARDEDGSIKTESPLIATEIEPLAALMSMLRLVAEAWDIGAYLLGRSFPGTGWRQWNGQFRDDVRAFVKGDAGMVGALMPRVYGSDDLFPDGPGDVYRPYQSVNFVTAHDGFCLYDLVAYNQKHNEANGHGNTRRASRQPELELRLGRRRGRARRSAGAAAPAGEELLRAADAGNGMPMFVRRRRVSQHPARQQQPVQPGQRNDLARLVVLEKNRDMFRFFK